MEDIRPDEWIADLKTRFETFAAEQRAPTRAIFPAVEVFKRRKSMWQPMLLYFAAASRRTAAELATADARLFAGYILRLGYKLVVVDLPTSGWVRLFKQRRVYVRAEGSETPEMNVTASQCNVDHLRHELAHIVLHEKVYEQPHNRHVIDQEARMLEEYIDVLLRGWPPISTKLWGVSGISVKPADTAGSEERLLLGAWRLYNLIKKVGPAKVLPFRPRCRRPVAGRSTDAGIVEVLATPENCATTALFSKIIGDSMSPVLESGWIVRIDTARRPKSGDVTAVYIHGEGGIVGYWGGGTRPMLEKENPAYSSVDLSTKTFDIVGVVVAVVSAPLLPRPRHS